MAHEPETGGAGPRLGAGQVLLQASPEAVAAEQLSDLYALSDPALAELGTEALLDEVLGRLRGILAVDTVAVLLHVPRTDELVARAAKGLEAEVEAGVRIPLGHGFAGRIAAGRRPIFVPDVARADIVNPILREIGIRSLLGVPLIAEGQLLGVLHVGSLTPREFGAADAALLELAAARMAPAIERARLFDELRRERLAAVTLQRSLLPDVVPDLPDVDVAVRYVPARDEVGGDFHDAVQVGDGQVLLAIGDVAGHGVRAAALMAQLRAVLRATAMEDPRPSKVLRRLDRYLQHSHPNGMATVVLTLLTPGSGAAVVSRAGHPPPVVAGRDGARLVDLPAAPPLGVRPFALYRDLDVELGADETLLLYTDGLVERRGEPLGTGLARLTAAAVGDPSPELLCSRVLGALTASQASEDDVALLAAARHAPPERLVLRLAAERDVLAPLRHRLRAWLAEQGARDDEARDVVLAVAEAAANAVEHAYPPAPSSFDVRAEVAGGVVTVVIADQGAWRAEPRGTHRGRGLTIMRATMDEVDVTRGAGGTEVVLRRRLGGPAR